MSSISGRRSVSTTRPFGEEGYEFRYPPSLEDYRALLALSVQSLTSPPVLPRIIFDRTPLDYLAYLTATGADPSNEADPAVLASALASLDLLVITVITPETEPAGRGPHRAGAGPSTRPLGLNAEDRNDQLVAERPW